MSDLDVHAPATQQPPAYADANRADELAKSGKRLDGRPLAADGYICYLPHPERHTNSAPSHPGFGHSPERAAVNARYWANQAPFLKTVPYNRAPKWAQEQATG